jgi:hypothetical protein
MMITFAYPRYGSAEVATKPRMEANTGVEQGDAIRADDAPVIQKIVTEVVD